MKKTIALILFCCFVAFGVQAQVKVAYTNVELIMTVMPEVKEVNKQLAEYEKQLEQKLKVKTDYYQQKAEEYYAKKQAGIAPEVEKPMVDELAKLEQEIRKAAEESDQKVMQKQMQLLSPVQTRLQNAITEVTQERGYNYTINQVIGEGVPTILYGHPDHDITEAIMEKLGIKMPEGDKETPKE